MNEHPRIQSYSCPCCGGFIGEAAPLDQVRERVTAPARRLIFDLISKRPGKPVLKSVIVDRLYGNRSDGGPDSAGQVVAAMVSQLRRQIEPFGWTITNGRGGSSEHAEWRLIPTEATP